MYFRFGLYQSCNVIAFIELPHLGVFHFVIKEFDLWDNKMWLRWFDMLFCDVRIQYKTTHAVLVSMLTKVEIYGHTTTSQVTPLSMRTILNDVVTQLYYVYIHAQT